MFKEDAKEALPIAAAVLNKLLAVTPLGGRPGSDLRAAVGVFQANAPVLIQNDLSGPPLADIFDKARLAGITSPQLDIVRKAATDQNPVSLGATLVRNALIEFTLATECWIIALTTYTSRNDVEATQQIMNAAFAPIEEIMADTMDLSAHMALITLHAALNYHLAQTARPLPRVLNFEFAAPAPTLYFAYRLYSDASRADELRYENKVVHPAFMNSEGRGLSA